ncbi:MAG: hypothetical protein JNM83_09840 [Myxococcales bacterium]|nr:hypothetical protein [Myxococcales bacterium]
MTFWHGPDWLALAHAVLSVYRGKPQKTMDSLFATERFTDSSNCITGFFTKRQHRSHCSERGRR